MAKTDWTINNTVKPDDMNEIGQEINDNTTGLATHKAERATPTTLGHVKAETDEDGTLIIPDVTKGSIGLGNVQNYGIATQAQAQAGVDNDLYMTPLRVAQAVAAQGSDIATGTYTGNNTNSRFIAVGFTPKFVILAGVGFSDTGQSTRFVAFSFDTGYGFNITGSMSATSFGIENGGFRTPSTNATFNVAGVTYHWVAFA